VVAPPVEPVVPPGSIPVVVDASVELGPPGSESRVSEAAEEGPGVVTPELDVADDVPPDVVGS